MLYIKAMLLENWIFLASGFEFITFEASEFEFVVVCMRFFYQNG